MKIWFQEIHDYILWTVGILFSSIVAFLGFRYGIILPMLITVLLLVTMYLLVSVRELKFAFYGMFFYCFLVIILYREISSAVPFGIGVEVFILLAWVSVFFNSNRVSWKGLNNDLVFLALFWFAISVLELVNPAGASPRGWVQEIRSSALYFILVVPLSLLVLTREKDLNYFLILIIVISVIGTFYGMRQLFIGLTSGEQRFLDEGAAKTHLLWGRLRVFSFYSDAGQFGASQAHICLIAIILAMGPFLWWKRVLLLISAMLLFYGMLISGTRGALFALVVGVFFALFLSKNFKVLLMGGMMAVALLGVLKYTTIGNGNYQVYRLRTALDPKDPSLNVRFTNQLILREYLSSRPFGGGLGVIGTWGKEYNKDKFLSTVEPDSYWVKVWAMYGIVGFIIWFGIMMYIIGKCCGVVWKIQDLKLKVKLIALTSGTAGVFFCSYGNEVMNTMPTALILYISWAFVYLGPKLDKIKQIETLTLGD